MKHYPLNFGAHDTVLTFVLREGTQFAIVAESFVLFQVETLSFLGRKDLTYGTGRPLPRCWSLI